MENILSIAKIKRVLTEDQVVHPPLSPEAADALGEKGKVITEVGFPKNFVGFFKPVEQIDIESDIITFTYSVAKTKHQASRSVQIGVTMFGKIVYDPKTECVVYIDKDGVGELINTSLEAFLYFAGRLDRLSGRSSRDIRKTRRTLEGLDPIPMDNPNAMWSFMLEEIENGIL